MRPPRIRPPRNTAASSCCAAGRSRCSRASRPAIAWWCPNGKTRTRRGAITNRPNTRRRKRSGRVASPRSLSFCSKARSASGQRSRNRISNAAGTAFIEPRGRCRSPIKEAHMSRALIARVVAAAAIATCLQLPAAQAQERDLKFVLDFISLGRHAPWYVALGKGYFKDEGLNVTIMPSKGTADAIRTVATGGAEIGFIDIPSLVASGSGGANVKIVAANYQKPPYCIFTLNPGANVTEPKQMAGGELGPREGAVWP